MADDNPQLKAALKQYVEDHRSLTAPDPATPPLPDLDAMADAARDEFISELRKAKQRQRDKAGAGGFNYLRWLKPKYSLPAVALVVVSLLLVTTMSPSGFVAPADPGDRAFTPGQPALPDHVRVDFKKGRIEFFGDGDSLAGTMTASPADSTLEIAAFQVAVKGKDSTGLAGEFAGKVFFTRSVSGKIPANKGDIKRIAAEGELRVTGAGPYQVKRSYLP